MKKLLSIIFVLLMSNSLLNAQTTEDNFQDQMEGIAKHMEEMMKNLGLSGEQGMIQIDTFFFNEEMPFQLNDDFFNNFQMDPSFSTDMLNLMEKQLDALMNDPNTTQQLDSLFRGFNFQMPAFPENKPKPGEKKKRKVYTL